MSVATHNRTLSKTEYINKIRELNVSVGRIVMNKPKKYRQNYGDAIIKSAIEALKFAQTANAIFVKHDMPKSDIALRRTMLIRAKGAVMNVSTISQIFLDLCMSADGENKTKIMKQDKYIGNITHDIIKMLSGVIKSDESYHNGQGL